MKPMLRLVLPLLAILTISLACSLTAGQSPTPTLAAPAVETAPQTAASQAAPQEQATQPPSNANTQPPQPTVAPATAASAGDDPFQPDPLDRVLDLRSVTFTLTTQRPDGATRMIAGQIDSAGALHIVINEPAYDISGMPAGFEAAPETPVVEFYVLDGKVYMPDAGDESWKTAPVDTDFMTSFSRELHGMESPALWLNLLPDGSVSLAGSEDSGGFQANHYIVSGQVSGQTITGSFWKDPQTNTLLAAELHVPAALLSAPDDPQSGELIITLKVEKAIVASISLP